MRPRSIGPGQAAVVTSCAYSRRGCGGLARSALHFSRLLGAREEDSVGRLSGCANKTRRVHDQVRPI